MKKSETPETAAEEQAKDDGATAYVNTTTCVINHNGKSVGPGGVLRLAEINMKDKGLMHLVSSGGLKPQK